LNLISAICRARPDQHFAAYLTPVVSETDLMESVRLLESLECKNLDILILDIFVSKSKINFHEAENNLAKALKSIDAKILLILSSFEKQTSVVSVPTDLDVIKFGILYDLIPLQFEKNLLISKKQKSAYLSSLNRVKGYDHILAISEESKSSWKAFVGRHPIVDVIYGGGIRNTGLQNKTFTERSGFLCVGAEQAHKNIENLILAYRLLPREIQQNHGLTIVGIRSPGARRLLRKMSSKSRGIVTLPDYLDASSLASLYQNSRLLVMPSLAEGLSLPILEAWSNGLVAIGSENTVAQELIEDKAFLFNPIQPVKISQKMLEFATDESLWQLGLKQATTSAQKFSWLATAARALSVVEGNIHG
jgi:glycosyltransferase involved in cell wall biosynthesis